MEFSISARTRRQRKETNREYESRLQIFKIPPVMTIDVEEFEALALRRQKCDHIASYAFSVCHL